MSIEMQGVVSLNVQSCDPNRTLCCQNGWRILLDALDKTINEIPRTARTREHTKGNIV